MTATMSGVGTGGRPLRPEGDDVRTYYGRPALKEPVWRAWIPTYLFAGGLAAGSSLLAAGASVCGDAAFARQSRLVAVGALGVGSVCLVADLGRPERFANMLRVAKPSSPMSVGTWVLAGYGPMAGAAAACDLLGVLPRVRTATTLGAALLAPALATYTGVLVADTAIPSWHDAYRALPPLFGASAAGAAGGAALVAAGLRGAPLPSAGRRLAMAGALGEGLISEVMVRSLPDAVRPAYEHGRARLLTRAATTLGLGGTALCVAAGRRRPRLGALGGACIAAASACERFAVMAAGRASARDPLATVVPQRERRTRRGDPARTT